MSKPSLNVVVIGHVDSGKSTLIGCMLHKLGLISQRSLHKNKTESANCGKGSFYLAWTVDETVEERTRGITMDINNEIFETEKHKIHIIDSPGHKEFIPNMITGVTQADAAIIVIDATEGAFEAGFGNSGQTKEHILIARYLGISQAVVIINKMDTVDWQEDRFDLITDQLKYFLIKNSFKESDFYFVPTSASLGINIESLSTDYMNWYKGKSLFGTIDNLKVPDRLVDKPLRLSVSAVYKIKQKKFKIYGKIVSGCLNNQTNLLCLPIDKTLSVKNLLIGSESTKSAFSGDQVEIDADFNFDDDIKVGNILCNPESRCIASDTITARIVTFKLPRPLIRGSVLMLHHMQLSLSASIKTIHKSESTKKTELKISPRFITGNSICEIDLLLQNPIAFDLFDEIKPTGRFILRDKNSFIGVGIMIKSYPS